MQRAYDKTKQPVALLCTYLGDARQSDKILNDTQEK